MDLKKELAKLKRRGQKDPVPVVAVEVVLPRELIRSECKCGKPPKTYVFSSQFKGACKLYCADCNPYRQPCSECNSMAIPFIDKFGRAIEDKCNVHGQKMKVTYEMIRQFSNEKRYLQIEQGLVDRGASLPITDFRNKNIIKAKNCLKTACACGKQATMFYFGKNNEDINTWVSHCNDCDTSNPEPKIEKQLAQETLTLISDPMVPIKRRVIEICTPLGAGVKVIGHCMGNLAVHRIPNTEKMAWTISHIPTGHGIVHGIAPFKTRDKASEVAVKLLGRDDWHIEGATWGYIPPSAYQRIAKLSKVIIERNSKPQKATKKSVLCEEENIPRVGKTKLEKAIDLYKKHIDGERWLKDLKAKGKDTSRYDVLFEDQVVKPLEKTEKSLSIEDAAAFVKVKKVVNVFSGNIILKEELPVSPDESLRLAKDAECKLCQKCGNPGVRLCLGNTGEKYKWGMFCLNCEPYNE